MALFESYERRIDKINSVLNSYGIASIEEAEKITKDAGLNVYDQIKGIQPICFENACCIKRRPLCDQRWYTGVFRGYGSTGRNYFPGEKSFLQYTC